jgi:hypothetical protein
LVIWLSLSRTAALESRGVEQRHQVFVPRRSQRRKLERIEKDAISALCVTDHEARTVAMVVAFDFYRGELADQTKRRVVRVLVGRHG